MPSSLHDAYMQAAMAETALRTVANPHDQALAALGVHPALHQASSVPLQSGLVNPHDFPSRFNNGFVNTALQSDCNGGGLTPAQQQYLEAEVLYEAALHNLRTHQVQDDRQALLASLPLWNAPLGPLQAEGQAAQLYLPQQLAALRPQPQQQPQQRRRGRRGGVRQHAYRNGQAFANRPNGPRPQGQPAQAPGPSPAPETAAEQQIAAAAISGGTGVFLPNRPQPLLQPTRKPAPGAPMSAPLPMSRAAAISKARIQAAANAAAGMPVPSAAYVPTSADLAASVRLAASGQLVHGASSLPHSAFFLQDPFLSGNSSLASTIYTPNGTQDMQGLISQLSGALSGATTGSGRASPRLTPMTTPRASEGTAAALRELIYSTSEDSSHSSANDLLISHDAAALLRAASAGGSLGPSQSMLNLYNMRTSAADARQCPSAPAGPPSRTGGDVFGHLWDT
ncbi:hypothetical protein COCSUDRAFT_39771 [Coccomyxa subellipsoidea C-169]|uniref:Uncharacterized protein n=1 Tax=Coccomyxa subellipsoidea (strain C-169) TaxID=574566 RepID=I0Z810_COCSC|nr:hypothetical protein COCSUDRAFT_39771 [Coccomyxa subellipsoidea C-169]EIE26779.1 hypothetical protein COCSUDRAFT_39771 [Coccomyxa subellipsoidea C-169]|eukprot:XP_005651323.1 hypothetical protein COCSUDRAFT_39771 [Coccomyxa subellipsoidea C-169]